MNETPNRTPENPVERRYRRDPLGTVVYAAIIIWAGIVLLADSTGLLNNFNLAQILPPGMFPVLNLTWTLIFLGAALIVAVSVAIRLLVPTYPRPVWGSYVFAVILLGLALGSLFGWNIVWPIVLIGLGITVLLRYAFRSRRLS